MKDILHLRAPGNWINDPNGFIYYKGKYHLFYQHFPYAPQWGTMHWGHAVSEDLVHWEHLGIALFPTVYEDGNGCFSGSAVEIDGKMNLYYTGVRYGQPMKENIHRCVDDDFRSSQLMITSEDGIHFDNFHGKRVIIPMSEDEEISDYRHTRDPKVWKEGEEFYMVLGSTYRNEVGRLLFYRSADGKNWEYASQLRSERFGKILECPDIFSVNGQYVFVGSPMYIEDMAGGYEHHAVCMPAKFDPASCGLKLPGHYQYVDYGLDLYAPQTNLDKDGRRVMVAWMRMPETVQQKDRKPWNGIMCLPRVVEVLDGHVYFRVHPEVKQYFSEKIPADDVTLGTKPVRLKVSMKEGEELNLGGYKIWVERDYLKTDRSQVFRQIQGHRLVSSTPKLDGKYELDIYVDENLIEVFVNDGQYVIGNVVYELGHKVQGRVEEAWQ